LHTQKRIQEKPIFTNLKKEFEHIELPAKLLDYILRSNKSNINQSNADSPTRELFHEMQVPTATGILETKSGLYLPRDSRSFVYRIYGFHGK